MNNKSIIPFSRIDKEKVIFPSNEESAIIENYLGQIDKFHTLVRSFHINNFNFHQILYHFTMHADDTLIRTNGLPSDDFIVINTLLINYLSTSKMFVDIVENFDKSLYDDIHSFISDKYDSSFYYQLMTELRNFSLHGHLPVYYNDGRYSFNLHYILEEGKKYKFNKARKEKFKVISQQIRENHNNIANISFSITLIEYHKVIIEIFEHFFVIYTPDFSKKHCNFRKIIDKYNENEKDNYACVYLDDSLHILNISNSMIETLKKEHSNAIEILNVYIKKFKELIRTKN